MNAFLEITLISCAVLGFRHGFDYDHIAAISDIEPLSNSEVKNGAPEYDEFRKRSLKIDENRGLRSVSSPAMASLIENPNLGDGGSPKTDEGTLFLPHHFLEIRRFRKLQKFFQSLIGHS